MDYKEEEEMLPVSPSGHYFNSSVLSVSVIAVLESEIPIKRDDSLTFRMLNEVFLPINPRFSSIMIRDKNGVKQWKKVQVKLEDHIHIPVFPEGKSIEFYDECFNDYLSKIALDPFPQNQPLWDIHLITYPTKYAGGNLVFRLHHALGDGFSLMGALLSCLQRADDPSLPITFPEFRPIPSENKQNGGGAFTRLSEIIGGIFNTVGDFGWSLMKSTFLEDDKSPIRCGQVGVEFLPITITTMVFSIDRIKQIKTSLGVSINDVICGVIFLGTRLYMQAMEKNSGNANSTALVLLNTRNIGGYKSLKEMLLPDPESKWGNQFGFLHVTVPKFTTRSSDPIKFIFKAQKIIKRKRNSGGVFLTGKLLDSIRRYRSPEVTSKYVHRTLKNSSMSISNVFGPVDRLALADHPIKGMYFMVAGVPESLTITMLSYMRTLRVAVGTQKGLIDPQKFKSCIEEAFDIIQKAVPSTD